MKRIVCMLLSLLPCLAGCAGAIAVSAPAQEFRDVPILMYHSVLKDPARTGKYVIPPEKLESDLQWLFDHGYTVVTAGALIDFANGRGTLPDKPVLITFDDGYLNSLTYVLPILEKYDCTALIAVVGEYAERFTESPDPNPNYAYLSWEEVYALALSGRFEIANHTYEMHGQKGRMGSARKRGESPDDYAAAFTADVSRMQEALAARAFVKPALFAYPYGVIGEGSEDVLRALGFSGTLTCNEQMNRIVFGNPETLWQLGRYNRTGELTTEAFMRRIGL